MGFLHNKEMLSVYPWLQNVVAAVTVSATAIAAGLLLRFRRDCSWGCGCDCGCCCDCSVAKLLVTFSSARLVRYLNDVTVLDRALSTVNIKGNWSWRIVTASASARLNTVMHRKPPPTHTIFKQPISQPILNGLNWNLAWWLSRWYRSSLEQKTFLAAASCLYTLLCQLVCLS